MAGVDEARAIEAHDALPLDRLRPWLEQALGVPMDDLRLGRFGKGWSNLTFSLTAGDREWVLRRPPPGVRIQGAHDMAREYRVVTGVGQVWEKVPRTVAVCTDERVLGGAFYVMERVRGVILRGAVPAGVVLDPDTLRRASTALVDTLVEIHGLDPDRAGLADLGRPEGYVRRQVEGWTRRYAAARTDDLPDMRWVADWLERTQPVESGRALIHNDYKYDNVVLAADDLGRVVAVLDWEMATIGCPRLDLGTALAWWTDGADAPELELLRLGPTWLPGNLSRVEVAQRYMQRTGEAFDPTWPFVFGLFKNAVVAQQLYARFAAGHTSEARYAMMIEGVKALGAVARRAAERGRISDLG